jgi:hypothetical protein
MAYGTVVFVFVFEAGVGLVDGVIDTHGAFGAVGVFFSTAYTTKSTIRTMKWFLR